MTCQYCHSQDVVDGVCEDCGKTQPGETLVRASTGGIDSPATRPTGVTSNRTGSTRFAVNYPTWGAPKGTGKTIRRRVEVSSHTSTRRNALGGGLVSLPDLPPQDPLALLMATPEVPEAKRRCSKCEGKVTKLKGFCPACGTPYDFVASLKAGDVVARKYEIKGPIAFGGLGWIYLGFDTVLSRYVVLKGLLNTGDEAAAAAAVAERRYLAAVKHPKIVGIYDFVSQGAEGFIIMEYVGGTTVQHIRKTEGPLPVEQAIAYILGILPAFAYLHAQGIVYCDFKPDNVMLESGDVKLIDMGAVRKIGDPDGDIYATIGFSAPEADSDPIAVSDLYTIGRALAVLIMDFKYASTFAESLPSPDDQAVLGDHESLYRFLLRATNPDPDERFQTADEMAEQLFGVLREIVALKSSPKPAESKIFSGDNTPLLKAEAILAPPSPLSLPTIRANLEDRNAGKIVQILSGNDLAAQLRQMSALVESSGDRDTEPRLRLAQLYISQYVRGDEAARARAEKAIGGTLAVVAAADPFEWRVSWLQGVFLLARGKGNEAAVCFEKVYFEAPGELAPQLAMGYAAEIAGQFDQALQYYDRVGRVDNTYVSAHFGAARCLAAARDLAGAAAALKRVPENHSAKAQANLAISSLLTAHPDIVDAPLMKLGEEAVASALAAGEMAYAKAAELIELALQALPKLGWNQSDPFLGVPPSEAALRQAAEGQYRQAARIAATARDRFRYVAAANAVRPQTLY